MNSPVFGAVARRAALQTNAAKTTNDGHDAMKNSTLKHEAGSIRPVPIS
jgi:hypothetical protein